MSAMTQASPEHIQESVQDVETTHSDTLGNSALPTSPTPDNDYLPATNDSTIMEGLDTHPSIDDPFRIKFKADTRRDPLGINAVPSIEIREFHPDGSENTLYDSLKAAEKLGVEFGLELDATGQKVVTALYKGKEVEAQLSAFGSTENQLMEKLIRPLNELILKDVNPQVAQQISAEKDALKNTPQQELIAELAKLEIEEILLAEKVKYFEHIANNSQIPMQTRSGVDQTQLRIEQLEEHLDQWELKLAEATKSKEDLAPDASVAEKRALDLQIQEAQQNVTGLKQQQSAYHNQLGHFAAQLSQHQEHLLTDTLNRANADIHHFADQLQQPTPDCHYLKSIGLTALGEVVEDNIQLSLNTQHLSNTVRDIKVHKEFKTAEVQQLIDLMLDARNRFKTHVELANPGNPYAFLDQKVADLILIGTGNEFSEVRDIILNTPYEKAAHKVITHGLEAGKNEFPNSGLSQLANITAYETNRWTAQFRLQSRDSLGGIDLSRTPEELVKEIENRRANIQEMNKSLTETSEQIAGNIAEAENIARSVGMRDASTGKPQGFSALQINEERIARAVEHISRKFDQATEQAERVYLREMKRESELKENKDKLIKEGEACELTIGRQQFILERYRMAVDTAFQKGYQLHDRYIAELNNPDSPLAQIRNGRQQITNKIGEKVIQEANEVIDKVLNKW